MFYRIRNYKIPQLFMVIVFALVSGGFSSQPVNASTVIHYVKWDATGLNDGSSWDNAYTDLSVALIMASPGDEFWVAAGTYKPTTSPYPGSDRFAAFFIENGRAVYGGFSGIESIRTQRNPSANVTILSGDLNGDDNGNISHDEPTRAENVLHVVAIGEAVLDGFTITGGNANWEDIHSIGGGVWIGDGNPMLSNLTVMNNSASAVGGGMNISNGGSPILTQVIFKNNAARGGGGLAVYQSSPFLSNVIFSGNTAEYSGGGVDNLVGGDITFENVAFIGNKSFGYGGGLSNHSSNAEISKAVFYDNHAYNSISGVGTGGGIYNKNSNVLITNTTFSSNTAEGAGSGIANLHSDPILVNVTIANNRDGIYNEASHPVVQNSIVWGNYPYPGFVSSIYDDPDSSTTVTDSVIENGHVGGTNIITTDPLLGSLGDYGGYTQTHALLPGSPAIDAADNGVCPATDQRGVTRDENCDIGAYEVGYFHTLTNLIDTPDPSVVGGEVAVHVTVSSGSVTPPTGTVDVSSSGSDCTITLVSGSGSCNLVFSSAGAQIIVATYGGDEWHSGSADSENHMVLTDLVAPTVVSILRADPNPTSATSVDFTVSFAESVTDVTLSDFALTTMGLSGTSITNVSGALSTYTVTVNTGTGVGTLRLDVVDDDSIVDGAGNPLGGVGAGNGDFASGEVYDVNVSLIIPSVGTYDGWILESSEASSAGGKLDKTAAFLRVGDDVANKQYRSILSFDTSGLPEGAVITSVTLKFKDAGKTGTLPFGATHGKLLADICEGAFKDNLALQLVDFNVRCPSGYYKVKALIYTNTKVDNWYSQSLLPEDFQFINLGGVTQFRLRFARDDNNDWGADFLKLHSGNALAESDRPQLVIEYYVP